MAQAISPHELDELLDRHPDIECLSLDCFDTLLWRDCHEPASLFASLPGTTMAQRAKAEQRARKSNGLAGRGSEVTIGQIYAKLMPNASDAERQEAVAAELAAEARHCFAFEPVLRLMRRARERGLQVVIVSDTYLDAGQLNGLIRDAAGEDVAGLIDRVFCSCEYGLSKAGGLYEHVLKALPIAPEAILHLGDNAEADVKGVGRFGVNAIHLAQFSDNARQRLRMEAAVDAMIHAPDAGCAANLMPHRASLSLGEPQLEEAAERLGASLLGPVFHGFEQWLREEAEELAAAHGGTVHWLFLMRDGHLPQRVHEQQAGPEHSHAAELSRFTATAASFTSERAIASWLDGEVGTRPQTLARQMLMPEKRIAELLGGKSLEEGSHLLYREARSGSFRKATIRASRRFGSRLVEHVRQACDPQRGDVLMLVDLGYNGTVQNRIDALLREELGVHVAGRYLLLREQDRPGLDKKGLIDGRHYDAATLDAMCANVSVLEQLCTKPQGSVVDYAEDGTPLRHETGIKQEQSETREKVQAGCLAFQRWTHGVTRRCRVEGEAGMWRECAASTLMRLMFLPLPYELAVIESFEHDVNLGTQNTVSLFDRKEAEAGLRQRGLFYMNGSQRMYLPAEMDGQGMAARLSLLAHRRFGLPFTFADFADRRIDLPVIYSDGKEAARKSVTATGTHDGHYLAAIPVGAGRYSVGLQFGLDHEWLELESLSFVPVENFISGTHEQLRGEIPAAAQFEAIDRPAPRLLNCRTPEALIFVSPPPSADGTDMMLACVFRPLVGRREGDAKLETEQRKAVA